MTEADPHYDVMHPSGHVLFRSARGGYLHSVVLDSEAVRSDAHMLAEAIVLAANVSYLRALMRVRQEIANAGHTPSADVPTRQELEVATDALQQHEMYIR